MAALRKYKEALRILPERQMVVYLFEEYKQFKATIMTNLAMTMNKMERFDLA